MTLCKTYGGSNRGLCLFKTAVASEGWGRWRVRYVSEHTPGHVGDKSRGETAALSHIRCEVICQK